MKRQAYQHPELRDANDNIIQEGTYGKASPLVNSDNTGVLDYINNNLEALYDAQTAAGNAITTGGLTVSGKTTTGTLDAGDTTVTGTVTTGGLTVTGETSAPTANSGNNSTTIATTAFVQAAIAALVDSAPDALNTLKELATALGNDADFSTTVTNAIAAKVAKAGDTITGDVDITGNLSVSGAITGNVTGNVTGTATRATKDGNGKNIASTYLPAVVGAVVAFAGSTTPQGWLLCDGSAVSRTDYAALYAVIGTTYGAGNGSTTFNLPNLVDKFVEGSATAGTVKSAGLPNITGGFELRPVDGGLNVTWEKERGAVKITKRNGDNSSCVSKSSSFDPLMDVSIDASRSSSIYGKSTTVQPPALTMRYIIKY